MDSKLTTPVLLLSFLFAAFAELRAVKVADGHLERAANFPERAGQSVSATPALKDLHQEARQRTTESSRGAPHSSPLRQQNSSATHRAGLQIPLGQSVTTVERMAVSGSKRDSHEVRRLRRSPGWKRRLFDLLRCLGSSKHTSVTQQGLAMHLGLDDASSQSLNPDGSVLCRDISIPSVREFHKSEETVGHGEVPFSPNHPAEATEAVRMSLGLFRRPENSLEALTADLGEVDKRTKLDRMAIGYGKRYVPQVLIDGLVSQDTKEKRSRLERMAFGFGKRSDPLFLQSLLDIKEKSGESAQRENDALSKRARLDRMALGYGKRGELPFDLSSLEDDSPLAEASAGAGAKRARLDRMAMGYGKRAAGGSLGGDEPLDNKQESVVFDTETFGLPNSPTEEVPADTSATDITSDMSSAEKRDRLDRMAFGYGKRAEEARGQDASLHQPNEIDKRQPETFSEPSGDFDLDVSEFDQDVDRRAKIDRMPSGYGKRAPELPKSILYTEDKENDEISDSSKDWGLSFNFKNTGQKSLDENANGDAQIESIHVDKTIMDEKAKGSSELENVRLKMVQTTPSITAHMALFRPLSPRSMAVHSERLPFVYFRKRYLKAEKNALNDETDYQSREKETQMDWARMMTALTRQSLTYDPRIPPLPQQGQAVRRPQSSGKLPFLAGFGGWRGFLQPPAMLSRMLAPVSPPEGVTGREPGSEVDVRRQAGEAEAEVTNDRAASLGKRGSSQPWAPTSFRRRVARLDRMPLSYGKRALLL